MVRILSTQEAIERLQGVLDTGDRALSRDQILAEYLRHALCRLATPAGSPVASEPVYVTALLNQVRRQVRPLWPELEYDRRWRLSGTEAGEGGEDPLRQVLESLDAVRDAADMGGGYWLPAPTRFVGLAEGRVLIVSGSDTRTLSDLVPGPITLSGIARLCGEAQVPGPIADDPLRWQPLERWQGGAIDEPLDRWTEGVLGRARADLRQSASECGDFEVYCPVARRRGAQFFRWIPAAHLDSPPPSLVLCRSAGGLVRRAAPWLGLLERRDGALRPRQEYPVEWAQVRRLQYGLDLLAGVSNAARLDPEPGGAMLILPNLLPPEERRLLVVLGEERRVGIGRYPLHFLLRDGAIETIRRALSSLHIEIS